MVITCHMINEFVINRSYMYVRINSELSNCNTIILSLLISIQGKIFQSIYWFDIIKLMETARWINIRSLSISQMFWNSTMQIYNISCSPRYCWRSSTRSSVTFEWNKYYKNFLLKYKLINFIFLALSNKFYSFKQ